MTASVGCSMLCAPENLCFSSFIVMTSQSSALNTEVGWVQKWHPASRVHGQSSPSWRIFPGWHCHDAREYDGVQEMFDYGCLQVASPI